MAKLRLNAFTTKYISTDCCERNNFLTVRHVLKECEKIHNIQSISKFEKAIKL